MRIISGQLRGRRLRAPEGRATRPTSDRVREALFNILSSRIGGAAFLDVCAGSGAVGLEALSRGAEKAVFVEHSRRALEHLEANIEHCGVASQSRIIPKEAVAALKALIGRGEQFDVVYVDPPYDADLYPTILQLLGLSELVAADGVVIVERWTRDRLPAEAGSLRHYRDVRHGNSTLAFYERI
ncbi:MAG: 16S rRNA (guanine(966)-N(2))-methyltransferase RsmD [Blastocatellia bacterium]|nr:16S rRNA (guanine(966)-N(2))-methyltransferase RsmD [Blastocatellia bacterium]